ncbi:SAM-dependent methyltransferase [Amycolatopsis sp. YIM 10]|uniref:SAM-dependent methyltransferase n=1 Tax=Amycolatopsis sp. YIM 10 TaxID=2653857 RepID=UPI0012906217|nr:SAM-dependent methyltransferase [Amycolatopsis sp. YIM 10]QFU86773.1 S-adenosyl methyltransferase [Amycolatopsis sp. YIM 10]
MSPTDAKAPSSVPVGVDPNRASIARVYDAALGGKDNYEIDREVIRQVKAVAPEIRDMAWANRNWLTRAVRCMVGQRIDQYIDCGSGLPTAENVHQVVQRANPDAVVVYTDNDPVVLAHAKALLADESKTYIASADIYEPSQVYDDPIVQNHIDFSRPIGLVHSSTIHHYPGDDYADLMRQYIDPLPSGSWVALSHFYDPERAELSEVARRMEDIFSHSAMGSGWFRTRAEILSMMPGLEIIAPQPGMDATVVPCDLWWPDGPPPRPLTTEQELIGCAVGYKP